MRHTRSIGILFVLLIAVIAFVLGIAAPNLWASGSHHYKPKVEKFEEADIYFELNNTDGDLGIHGKVDGGPWTKIWLQDSHRRKLMEVKAKGRLRRQGVTELFFESAEPTFDEVSPERFFNRFPEGKYRIYSESQDGGRLIGKSFVWHVMPAAPDGIEVSGTAIDLETVDCEEEAPVVVPDEDGNIVISWDPVTTSHPDLGAEGDIEAALYQLVVEIDLEIDGREFTSVYSVDLPPDVTSMMVPEAFINIGLDDEGNGEYKFEILVKEEVGGNQTATESCFAIGEEDGDE